MLVSYILSFRMRIYYFLFKISVLFSVLAILTGGLLKIGIRFADDGQYVSSRLLNTDRVILFGNSKVKHVGFSDKDIRCVAEHGRRILEHEVLIDFLSRDSADHIIVQMDPEYLLSPYLRELQIGGVEFLEYLNTLKFDLWPVRHFRGRLGTILRIIIFGHEEFTYLKNDTSIEKNSYLKGGIYWNEGDSLFCYNTLVNLKLKGLDRLIIMPHNVDTNLTDNAFIEAQCQIIGIDFTDYTCSLQSYDQKILWQDASHLSEEGSKLFINKFLEDL
jgi:hypothetical protein